MKTTVPQNLSTFEYASEYSSRPSMELIQMQVNVDGLNLDVHLCADTIPGLVSFVTVMQSEFSPPHDEDGQVFSAFL